MADEVTIGDLRWPVTIALRRQSPGVDGSIVETFEELATVRAGIEPIGALTFWSAQQTDTPVTHRIKMRWLDGMTNEHIILRERLRPNNDPLRELFRVRRIKEIAGRQRFVIIEAELEVRADG